MALVPGTPDSRLSLQPALAADFDLLLALRIRAMQPSLQALGRFDPERARERFASTFLPEHMQHILLDGQRVGCVSLRPKPAALRMDHLYIEPAAQKQGIGAWVMDCACSLADLRQQPLELAALQGSDANRFYQRHGLKELSRSNFDIEYRRAPAADPRAVVRELWARFQARDWAGARQLVHDDAVIQWPATGEQLVGGDTFIAVNAQYPEGWTVHLLDVQALLDGRVLSMTRVEHPPHNFLVQATVRVRDGRIAHGLELWATCEKPPAWRSAQHLSGVQRVPGWSAA
ncbi:MAG: GNAT family N-acetyltransferase [Rubrivivax sp.]|nr:GNAT family N-acetyltransferase [Rubrivivax sp.]